MVGTFRARPICHMMYIPISPQGMPRHELSCCGNLRQLVEFKIVPREDNYVANLQSSMPNPNYTWDASVCDTLPFVSARVFKTQKLYHWYSVYVSKNRIHFCWCQSHLPCLHELNYQQFNHHKNWTGTIVHIWFSVRTVVRIRHFSCCKLWCTMNLHNGWLCISHAPMNTSWKLSIQFISTLDAMHG